MKKLLLIPFFSIFLTTNSFAEFIVFNTVIVERSNVTIALKQSRDAKIEAVAHIGLLAVVHVECDYEFVSEKIDPLLPKIAKLMNEVTDTNLGLILTEIGLTECVYTRNSLAP